MPRHPCNDIDEEVERLMAERLRDEEEREKNRLSTLDSLKADGAAYALNEVTGEIVWLEFGSYKTLLEGNVGSPEVLCQLLFDQEGINKSWSKISYREAHKLLSLF